MTSTQFILRDILDAVEKLAAISAEFHVSKTEDHRFVRFLLERASRELESNEQS